MNRDIPSVDFLMRRCVMVLLAEQFLSCNCLDGAILSAVMIVLSWMG